MNSRKLLITGLVLAIGSVAYLAYADLFEDLDKATTDFSNGVDNTTQKVTAPLDKTAGALNKAATRANDTATQLNQKATGMARQSKEKAMGMKDNALNQKNSMRDSFKNFGKIGAPDGQAGDVQRAPAAVDAPPVMNPPPAEVPQPQNPVPAAQ